MQKIDLSELPDEVRELIAPYVVNTEETLAAIGLAIAERRNDAKAARTSSGIDGWPSHDRADSQAA